MKRILIIGISVLLAGFFSLMVGCGKDSDTPQYKDIEGRVASINLETDVVKMWWYSPKKRKEIALEGKLSSNAEILINGVVARLEDLRVDDRVKVIGRIEKSGGQKTLFATQVNVTRPQSIEINPSTQPKASE